MVKIRPYKLSNLLPLLFLFAIIVTSNNAYVSCAYSAAQQYEVLQTLYNSTRDLTLRWRQLPDFCEWSGVQCDTATGKIYSVDLNYADNPIDNAVAVIRLEVLDTLRVLRLRGFRNALSFSGLYNLIGLQELNFEKSNFQIDISSSSLLTQLHSLHTLDLRDNNISSELGSWMLTHPSLRTVLLNGNFIFSLSGEWYNPNINNAVIDTLGIDMDPMPTQFCDRFSNLRELSLGNLTKSPDCIASSVRVLRAQMPKPLVLHNLPDQLRELRLHCALTKDYSSPLVVPDALDSLEIQNCRYQYVEIYGDTRRFKELVLVHIRIFWVWDIFETLALQMPNLEVVNLSNNQIEGSLPELADFPNLRVFNISDNRIGGRLPSTALPKLRVLDISRCKLSGTIPPSFCGNTALEHVSLNSNSLIGVIPDCLGRELLNLTSLDMHMNSLVGDIPKNLLAHSKLTVLDLGLNELSGTVEDVLTEASSLTTLRLASNKLNGSLPSILPHQLSTLDLSSNNIHGSLLGSSFAGRPLRTVLLYSNKIYGTIPQELADIPSLEVLDLGSNRLTGHIPKSLMNAPLRYLDLANNELTGSIPELTIPCKWLYLNNNAFSGMFPAASSTFYQSIEVIDISHNRLEGHIVFPGLLPELRALLFVGNKVTYVQVKGSKLIDISAANNEISGFSIEANTLQVFNMANNKISGVPQFMEQFPVLTRFDMSQNQLDGFPMRASHFPWLRYLNISHNNIHEYEIIVDVPVWTIETIDCSHNHIGAESGGEFPFRQYDTIGEQLRHLINLHMNDNHFYGLITDINYDILRQLHVLNMANNKMYGKVNAEVLRKAVQTTPMVLRTLNFSGNPEIVIDDSALSIIVAQPFLHELSISHCSVEGVPELPLPNDIEVLQMSGCGLKGELSKSVIERLVEVELLDLSFNSLTRLPEPSVWESLISLEHLDLSNNVNLTGVLPEYLRHTELRYIDFSNTKLSGAMPIIRSSVIEVVRFANCSLTGDVNALVPQRPLEVFDISNNYLRAFKSEQDFKWEVYSACSVNGQTNASRLFARECNMRGNHFQCHLFHSWMEDCCNAECSELEITIITASASVGGGILLVIIFVLILCLVPRWVSQRRNERSLVKLERSMLAEAFDNVEHDMMISWTDIKFVAKIGEGAFGIVYKGVYKGVDVAVKTFKVVPSASLSVTDESAKASSSGEASNDMDESYKATMRELINEVRFLMKLKHPYIVMLMGASVNKGRMAIVLEYMHNGSLYHLLHKTKIMLDWKTKCRIAFQIACGMQYLHLQNPPVIHRDLKSMNILIDNNFTAKITDFGFSRENGESVMTSMIGTISYMAPEMFGLNDEQASANESTSSSTSKITYGTACDVYSFGILMWELLYAKIPWHNCGQPTLIASVLRGDRPSIPSDTGDASIANQQMTSSSAVITGNEIELKDATAAETVIDVDRSVVSDTSSTDKVREYIELMKRCWAQNAKDRPNFSTIADTLKSLV